jgi:sulfoxide reductase heme-binding subunit YedZ
MTNRNIRRIKAGVWVAGLAPAVRLLFLGLTGGLGANPIEYITLATGSATLVLLLVTLAITPLRVLTRQNWLIRLRRLAGLFAFFYATMHFITYIWLDQFFDFPAIVRDIERRPFITAGFAAFVLMVPLAATSTAGAIRRMGGRRWQLLHRLVYISGVAAIVHFWWKVKADIREPAVYAIVLALLLGFRLIRWLVRKTTANHNWRG